MHLKTPHGLTRSTTRAASPASPCPLPQVKDITKRFLKPGFTTVDLVGTDKMKVRAWGRGRDGTGAPL